MIAGQRALRKEILRFSILDHIRDHSMGKTRSYRHALTEIILQQRAEEITTDASFAVWLSAAGCITR